MSPTIGLLGVIAILVLIMLRFPVGLALGVVSFVGIIHFIGFSAAIALVADVPHEFAARWTFTAIPMFLLMGTIAHHTGMTTSLFRAARLWLGFLPGGLAVATNFACAGFGAASGSSLATTVAMGRIAIPEMLRYRYDRGLASAVCACGGTLGALIPPSILMVLYGIFAEQSISKLFIAGILPGILTAVIYSVMIVIRCSLNPKLAPTSEEKVPFSEKIEALGKIWPLPLLILGVMGGIYSGFFTPTEAGAVGAVLALLIAIAQKRMTRKVLGESVREAIFATATIFFVAVGAVLLTKFLTFSGLPRLMVSALGAWSVDPLLLLLATSLIYIILGMFLDPLGLMLLTLPILLPLFATLNFDLIWVGILVVKFVEIGLMTPPVGLNVYAIYSLFKDEISLMTIFKGAAWFLLAEVVIMALLIAFPEISLLLPNWAS